MLARIAATAIGSQTVRDLLDAGAMKLSKQQMLDTLDGATVGGRRADGGTFEAVYKADGTYNGTYQGGPGMQGIAKGGGYFGKFKRVVKA